MEDLKETVGRNIKKLRLENNETMVDLAEKLGVRHATVSDWETGKKMPRSNTIQKIALHYNVLMSDIVTDSQKGERTKNIADSDIVDIEKLLQSETRLVYNNKVLTTKEKAILDRLVKAVILQ